MRMHEIILLEHEVDERKERARQMGFDTSRVWYHGTTGSHIDTFDPQRLGRNTGAKSATKGFFFTSHPTVAASYGRHERYTSDVSQAHIDRFQSTVAELAAEMKSLEKITAAPFAKAGELEQAFYSLPKKKRDARAQAYYDEKRAIIDQGTHTPEYQEASEKWKALNAQKNELEKRIKNLTNSSSISKAVVHPVYLKLIKPLIYDMNGNHYRETSYNDILVSALRGRRDGAIIKNTFDPGYRGAENPMCDIAVVFKPNQIRSVFANFDPTYADSGDINA